MAAPGENNRSGRIAGFCLRHADHSRAQLKVLACATVIAALATIVLWRTTASAHVPVSGVTYTQDVEPILRKRCMGCHDTGGSAPMWLDTYARARNWSQAIRRQILTRRMPPWPADVGYGLFANDATLSPAELDVITAWADGGTPLGVAPPPDTAPPDRPTPDRSFVVPSTPAEPAPPRFRFSTRLQQDQRLAAWTYRPAPGTRMQEATLWIDDLKVGSWTPVETIIRYPTGVTQPLPASAVIGVDVRALPGPGRPVPLAGTLELYFAPDGGTALMHQTLRCGDNPIDRHIAAVSVTPRAAADHPFELVLRRPDRSVDPVIVIARYEPRYPVTYRFASAIDLPSGTVMQLRSTDSACSAALDFTAAPSSPRPPR